MIFLGQLRKGWLNLCVLANFEGMLAYRLFLIEFVVAKGLRALTYPDELIWIANRAPVQVAGYCQSMRMPFEIGKNLIKLAFYDIFVFIGAYVAREACQDSAAVHRAIAMHRVGNRAGLDTAE